MLRNIIVMVSIKEFEKGGGFGFWAGFEEVYVQVLEWGFFLLCGVGFLLEDEFACGGLGDGVFGGGVVDAWMMPVSLR